MFRDLGILCVVNLGEDVFNGIYGNFIYILLLEVSLRKANLIVSERQYFPGSPIGPMYVEDDHVPFLSEGENVASQLHFLFTYCSLFK